MVKARKSFKICVIGSGYVGLVAAACFSKLGNRVICVDKDRNKISRVKKGVIPIYESGLDKLVRDGVKKKHLFFTSSVSEGVQKSDIVFISVGTPSRDNGEADLSAIENVARYIAGHLNSYKLIVEKSTVPVQTGKKIRETIKRYSKKGVEFDVASNPEFLREGRAVNDFLSPDRIVLGVESKRAENILKALYKPVKAPVLVTDINTAELIKHASNSFLAAKISFINSVSLICEETGADIEKVALGMGMDKRIGRSFLDAGIGFGGSCFPKDVSAFIQIAKKSGVEFKILEEVKKTNSLQRRHFVEKIKEELWILRDKKIGVLGVSFKPDTDDIRESPAVDIINMLLSEGAKIKVYDPKALPKAKKILKGVTFCKNVYSTAKDADCIALLTEWEEFRNLDFKRLKLLMKYPFLADGRNFLNKDFLESLGFKYTGVGR